jgi:uncharacterized membrane protein
MDLVPIFARWLHFMAGIMWIGLLYYFNFVQVPALKAAAADNTASGITKHVAPRALFYFRWASLVTWLAGAALLGGQFVNAFTLSKGMAGIGIGAWLGTIMLLNVWGLIWPNQKKILGIKPATDEEKTAARRIAFLASRTNVALSIPMLFFMAGGWSHRGTFGL